MVPPIFLSEAVLDQASAWKSECARRWCERGNFPKMGEATLHCEDGQPAQVTLHLGTGLSANAKVCSGIRNENGTIIGEGYTIIVDRNRLKWPEQLKLSILLHEITHTIDPYFRADLREMTPLEAQGVVLGSVQLYELASEQRAFSAMWTADLKDDLRRNRYTSPETAVHSYEAQSPNFKGFLAYGPPNVRQQTLEHFRLIVEELQRRLSQ